MKLILPILWVAFCLSLFGDDFITIDSQEAFNHYGKQGNTLVVASPGRSGSTLLTNIFLKQAHGYRVFKTHLLPPSRKFKGKIIFVFSNPDLATDSVFHLMFESSKWEEWHFHNVETSDKIWYKFHEVLGGPNEMINLLVYDALGIGRQLKDWLNKKVERCSQKEAQILAIKYEALWEIESLEAIRSFLQLPEFTLPEHKKRGNWEIIYPEEKSLREKYNKGSEEMPIYPAYDIARDLWTLAPKFQFLKIK